MKSIPGVSEAFPNRSEYIRVIIKAHAKPRELIGARFSIFFEEHMEACESPFHRGSVHSDRKMADFFGCFISELVRKEFRNGRFHHVRFFFILKNL